MKKTKQIRAGAICLALLFEVGCGANEGVLRSGNETPIQTNALEERPSLQNDLSAMQTAGFTFVYELRRHDGKIIDAEDVRVIKELTADTNRRVKSDNDKVVLIGSNFEVPKDSLSSLYARFLVKNHSKPRFTDTNIGLNSNK